MGKIVQGITPATTHNDFRYFSRIYAAYVDQCVCFLHKIELQIKTKYKNFLNLKLNLNHIAVATTVRQRYC